MKSIIEKLQWLSSEEGLKLLAIDGVYPTDATIADGTYPLAGYNYAVVRADEPKDSPARKMVQFLLSEAGQQCVETRVRAAVLIVCFSAARCTSNLAAFLLYGKKNPISSIFHTGAVI